MAEKKTTIRGKASKATGKAASSEKLSTTERWQASVKSGEMLLPHTRDENGNANKDYAYCVALLHAFVHGEKCTLAVMRTTYGFTGYADSKLRSWLNVWPKMYAEKLTHYKSFCVPKNSREWRLPRSKSDAKRMLADLTGQREQGIKKQKAAINKAAKAASK